LLRRGHDGHSRPAAVDDAGIDHVARSDQVALPVREEGSDAIRHPSRAGQTAFAALVLRKL
jgi:hypothetical protein